MFTGIIEDVGIVKAISQNKDTYRLEILSTRRFDLSKKGDSFSINGVCLTLVDIKKKRLSFDIMDETYRNTSFSYLYSGHRVNIERSLKSESRLEGHFVLGHVDSTQRIRFIKKNITPYRCPCKTCNNTGNTVFLNII